MKLYGKWLLLLLCALLLTGCGDGQPQPNATQTPEAHLTIAVQPDESMAEERSATLYFRYQDTEFLKQEVCTLSILPNETRELALVNALLAGSDEGGEALFSPGVVVLSTQVQDGVVFVTFNEAIYGRYEDENNQTDLAEAMLRRELAMDALVATLTEDGRYHAVQVLVRAQSHVGSSMRLKNSYFLRGDELPCELLTRSEAHLMTPANVAKHLLEAWQQRRFDALYPLLSSQEDAKLLPSQALFSQNFVQSDALIAFAITPGSLSADGQSALLCVDMTLLRSDGGEYAVKSWPLRLKREAGAWKVSLSALKALMQRNEE